MKAQSLLQVNDREEHRRLRRHMSAFFAPQNVELVYTALRDTAIRKARAAADGSASSDSGAGDDDTTQDSSRAKTASGMQDGSSVDAWAFAHELINEVVMQVCC